MRQREESIGKGIDSGVVMLYYLLLFVGFIAIFSVEYRPEDSFWKSLFAFKNNYSRQLLFIGISSVLALFILKFAGAS